MNDLRQMAQAIVAAHGELALAPGAWQRLAELPAPLPIQADALAQLGQAARLACRALDFSDADADLIACAWQAQTRRSGAFDALRWPCEPQDFGLAPAPRADAFAACPRQLGLYAILPDAQWVGRMARAGVPTVQLRLKTHDAASIAREVRAAVQAVQGTGCRLFINDHWQAAIEAGAYGVHLGQDDLAGADLAALRRAGLRLGLSSHGYAEILRAERHGPSYIAIGAVFATRLKTELAAQGTARLARYAQLLRDYPTVAIGGIDRQRLPAVLASGVGSAALISALTASAAPEREAARLMALFAS